MSFFPHSLTWTCHICGQERPDDKISVLTKPLALAEDLLAVENIRYCNDRESCIEAAKEFSFIRR